MGGKGTSQIPLWVLSLCQGDIPFVLKGKIPQKSRRLEKKRKNIKPTTSFLFFSRLRHHVPKRWVDGHRLWPAEG